MTGSYRTTPIMGIAGDSDKKWKQMAHKKKRRKIHMWLSQLINLDLLTVFDVRNVSSTWDSPKDGKIYFDKKKYPHLMRK